MVLNIVLGAILMFFLKISGLALATAISGIFNFFLLFFALRKKIGGFDDLKIVVSFLKMLASSAVMAGLIYFSAFRMGLNLFIVILIGIVSYMLAAFVFRVRETREFLKWVLRRN